MNKPPFVYKYSKRIFFLSYGFGTLHFGFVVSFFSKVDVEKNKSKMHY